MAPPTFIKCSESEQIAEMKDFLITHGIKKLDDAEVTQENWSKTFLNCLPHIHVCWTNDKIDDSQAVDFLTTVASLVIQLPVDEIENAVQTLCCTYEKFKPLKTEDSRGVQNRKHFAILFSLNVLFTGLPVENHSRFRIYQSLVTCASQHGSMSQIFTDSEKVSALLKVCQCSSSECRSLWRQLAELHKANDNIKQATQAMTHLLTTYDEGDAAGARVDAVKCIVYAIEDLSFLSHNRLMNQKPIQILEGEPIYMLLQIFISGNLADFLDFTKKHPKFLVENGLNEKTCLDKLRTLSLMELAENVAELDYETICKKIDLPEDQLEAFIIEAVCQRVISCKLDQINRKILITGALPRNFGRSQWLSLQKTLHDWKSDLEKVQKNLGSMIDSVES